MEGSSSLCTQLLQIGTPLPSLDSKKDANEYKPIWQQEALDEQGRRRFHGAFTGGFSAGYYNTVGSKEGWTPSTFRSSRKDKERQSGSNVTTASRPEDFMDEEDLEALREGRGALGSTQTYGMEKVQPESDPLMAMLRLGSGTNQAPSADSSSSIQLSSSSLGTRLLQRMGWRSGQGLGPRISFKKRLEMLALMGKAPPDDEKEDKEAGKHLWPPPDTPMPIFSTKQDTKGLGWTGQSSNVGLDEAIKRARAEESRKAGGAVDRQTGGFGLGTLEDDSDGEEEVYATGNKLEDSTLARKFHTRWGHNRDQILLGTRAEHPAAKEEVAKQQMKKDENVWHDGKAMTAGFQIASRNTEKEAWFEAPTVPVGWKPDPQQVWSLRSDLKTKSESSSNLDSADRAYILGEARLPGPPPSIQDYLSQKDKERLQKGKEAAEQHTKQQQSKPASSDTSSHLIPKLDAALAKSALQGFMPFTSEPEKQARYRGYLTSQAGVSSSSTSLRPGKNQTHQQFIAELRDFAKSASIFKPMSTVMASRFQSSISGSSDLPQINPGLHIPEQKPILSVEEEKVKADANRREEDEKKRREDMETLTPFQRNARLDLFGKDTTRETKIWKPNRLLCKRFNVPMPYPEEGESKAKEESDKFATVDEMEAAFGGASKVRQMDLPKINARWEESKKQLQQLAAQRSFEDRPQQSEMIEEESIKMKPGFIDVNNIGLGEVEEKEEVTFIKPSIDVFKAVFADDDDDEDDEDQQVAKTSDEIIEDGDAESGNTKRKEIDESTKTDSLQTLKPTFIPRKRPSDESGAMKNEKKRKKEKSKSKGLLTFSVDEGEEENDFRSMKATIKVNRPRAADLFN